MHHETEVKFSSFENSLNAILLIPSKQVLTE